MVDYIYLNGEILVRIERTNDLGPRRFTYHHSDQVGTVAITTDRFGAIKSDEFHSPFGEVEAMDTDQMDRAAFGAHIRDEHTHLSYMQARYYSPVIGRFLSVDPVTFMDKPYPGQFNRYAYTWNHPINANDPDGEFINFIVGAAIGAAIETGSQLIANGGDFSALDAGAIGKSAAIGSLTGGVGGALGKAALTKAAPRVAAKANTAFGSVKASAASGALEGGIGAGIGDVANQLTDGQAGVNLGQTASAVGQGAALGAVSGGASQATQNGALRSQGMVEPTAANLTKSGLKGPFPGSGSGATAGAAAGAAVSTTTGIASERLEEVDR